MCLSQALPTGPDDRGWLFALMCLCPGLYVLASGTQNYDAELLTQVHLRWCPQLPHAQLHTVAVCAAVCAHA